MSGRTNVCRKKEVTPHEGAVCGAFAVFPKKRDLDGVYFRVKRDGKWGNACFSDMTPEEIEELLVGRSAEWWKSLACHLGERLRVIGDQFDIVGGSADAE
jgi:hypothetical protein